MRKIFAFTIAVILMGVMVYNLPPVHDRLAWRVEEFTILVKAMLAPPEQAAFVVAAEETPAAGDPSASTDTPTPTWTPEPSATPTTASTPLPSPTPTLTPTPLPASMNLTGVRYFDQHGLWNYCAPATLAMGLSYWGWPGDRLDAGEVLKPYQKDKNVMPYEMVDYVLEQTDLKALYRVGGDPDLIKRFIAASLPVLAEKGTWIRDINGIVSWMGHYELVTGWDDAKGVWITQDSYYSADYEVPYDVFLKDWRSFNYTYILIYPPDREAEVMALLGPDADTTANFQRAAQKASDEVFALEGVDQFFAWFNRGTNLKELQDYGGAAAAYDEAFAIYNGLPEDKSIRPYRVLWYQTGPYFAYYYTQRYMAVINLASTSIEAALDEPALEESFYWRAMAKAAAGDTTGAIEDYQSSLKYHPGFEPTVYQLQQLGVEP